MKEEPTSKKVSAFIGIRIHKTRKVGCVMKCARTVIRFVIFSKEKFKNNFSSRNKKIGEKRDSSEFNVVLKRLILWLCWLNGLRFPSLFFLFLSSKNFCFVSTTNHSARFFLSSNSKKKIYDHNTRIVSFLVDQIRLIALWFIFFNMIS